MKRTLNPPESQPTWLNLFLGAWWIGVIILIVVILYLVGAYFQSPVYQSHVVGWG